MLLEAGLKVADFARGFEEGVSPVTLFRLRLRAAVCELDDILASERARSDADRYCAIVVISMQIADVLVDASLVAEEEGRLEPPQDPPRSDWIHEGRA